MDYIGNIGLPYDDEGFRDCLSAVTKALQSAKSMQAALTADLEQANAESSDLLHFIELHDNLNASQGYKIYAKLADNRRQRREIKKKLEFLEPLCRFMETHEKLPGGLSKLHADCNAVIRHQKEANYKVKTNTLEDFRL